MRRTFGTLEGKRWFVMGAARSGRGAVRLLRAAGYQSRWADERVTPEAIADETLTGEWRPDWLDGVDGVIWSPGIPLSHGLARETLRRGLPLVSEIELAWRFAASPVIAVTGSNGKTTTTSWIAHLLRADGRKAVESGNIGYAFSEVIAGELEGGAPAQIHVVEASSFQLETIHQFRPHAALILNITPDHLDRYPDVAAYAGAKERIVLNMGPEQTLVVNGQDAYCLAIARRAKCPAVFFGEAPQTGQGALLEGGRLLWRSSPGEATDWVGSDELIPPGAHNVQNALAAAAAAKLLCAGDEAIRRGLRDFAGVEHRIEFVAEIDGARYFNDSKATNVPSLEAALRSFACPVVLIAGGRDKNSPFGDLRPLVRERVAHLILLGEAARVIESHWKGLAPLTVAPDMKAAVVRAREVARPGQVVLLSPACASYDQYNNYEERGRDFKRIVQTMKEELP